MNLFKKMWATSGQNRECDNCLEMKKIFAEAKSNPHKELVYVYNYLKERYDNHLLKLYFSDCSFDDFLEEIYEEKQFTYYVFMQCPKCKTVFKLGVCVRGTPLYEICSELPDIAKLRENAYRDKKKIYLE